MRKTNNFVDYVRENYVDILMPIILFGIMFAWMALCFQYSKNTVRETYTISCEVTDKIEAESSEFNPALSALLNMPMVTTEKEYIVVVENEGESYEIKVDKEMYDEIQIGDMKMCEIETKNNELTQEYSYEGSFVEE